MDRAAVGDAHELSDTVLAVLNGIPGLVGYWDAGLRNRMANAAYLDYFGMMPDQIYGLHLRDVIGDESFESSRPEIEATLAGTSVTFDRALTKRSDGSERHVQVSYIPDLRDDVVVGFFALVTDVTERVIAERAVRDSMASWRSLARSVPDGFVLVYDKDLRFTVADGPQLATVGLSPEIVEGSTAEDVFGTELAERYSPHLQAALAGTRTQWEHVVGRHVFALTAGPVDSSDGSRPSVAMVTALDVSEQRLNERIWAALHSIATEVARRGTPDQVAALIAASLLDVFAVDRSAVIRYTGPRTADVVAVAPSGGQTQPTVTFTPGDSSTAAQILTTGAPVLTRGEESSPDVVERAAASGLPRELGAPIRYAGRLWGAVVLASADDDLDERVIEPLMRFAELVELAIATTESWEVLSRHAEIDELTGLPNRRVFNIQLQHEVDRARLEGTPLGVAMVDLDLFKQVNDEFGHALGDLVLTELGRRVAGVSEQHELLARVGGDEFGWLLRDTDPAAAAAAAHRLRDAVGSEPFPIIGTLAVSVGVAMLDDTMDGPALLAAADRALYLAKRSGRDTVVMLDEPESIGS